MTLSYTRRLHLAVPDFLSEPWHAEFAQAMESIDTALYNSIIGAGIELWVTNHDYALGDLVIDPQTGTLYASSVVHTSSRPTFAEERAAFPGRWTSFAVDVATQAEAEQGLENTHYMTPLRVSQAIDVQSPTPSVATQGQAEEGSDNATMMTPLRTVQQINARLATQVDAEAGTDNVRLMTPLRVAQAIDALGLPGGSQVAFSAHKNGTNQVVTGGLGTKLTFTTELYDLGNFFDTANSRWTPPAGNCHIDAAVFIASGLTSSSSLVLSIYKNGVLLKSSRVTSTVGAAAGVQVSVDDVGNATDYYEVFLFATGSSPVVSGVVSESYFMGHFLGEVSSVVLGHAEIGFRAWKNSVNQTLVDSVDTKVTFGTEIYDQGGYYEPSTSRWTPSTGMVHITGRITYNNVPAAGYWNRIMIYKNGVVLAQHMQVSTYNIQGIQIDIDDVASGSDYYEVFGYGASFSPIVDGTAALTYFTCHRVGGPQGDAGVAGPTGPSGTVSGIVVPPQGRLTLTTNTPVMTATASGVSIVRYTPYLGDRIPIYDGTGMVMVSFTELSQLMNDSTKSPAAAVPETVYDMFVWVDSGVTRLSRGPAWSKTSTVAISSPATPTVITWIDHGLHEGSPVVFTTTGTLPLGITAGATYYVGRNATATTFNIATSAQNAMVGTNVATTGTTQSGTHTGTNGDSTRGTGTGTGELARVQGLLVNAFGITRGPVANRGTYVGTIRSDPSGLAECVFGSRSPGGGAARIMVWNCYNRVELRTAVQEATTPGYAANFSFPAHPAAFPLNNSSGNRISIVCGLAEDGFSAEMLSTAYMGASILAPSVGFDVTNLTHYTGGVIGYGLPVTIPSGMVAGYQVPYSSTYGPTIGTLEGIAMPVGTHYFQATTVTYQYNYLDASTVLKLAWRY